jgi:hypothetical protein
VEIGRWERLVRKVSRQRVGDQRFVENCWREALVMDLRKTVGGQKRVGQHVANKRLVDKGW